MDGGGLNDGATSVRVIKTRGLNVTLSHKACFWR